MFRSALLALKPSVSQRFVIDAAAELAETHSLEVTACTVVDASREAPAEAVPLGASAYKQHHDEHLLLEARKLANESVAACQAACQQRSVACQTMVVDGHTVEQLAYYANGHDLLLVGHSVGDDTGDESVLHQILKHSARPALVFPKQATRTGDVVIAYDGSLQAARTLASFAYSGLAQGRTIHILSLHDKAEVATRIAEQAREFLQRHQIAAQLHAESIVSSISEMLLNTSVQCSAGMLVMGAFGQNAVREFLFGSVTRRVLQSLAIPVFLHH